MSALSSPAAGRSPSFIRQAERGRRPASICQPRSRIAFIPACWGLVFPSGAFIASRRSSSRAIASSCVAKNSTFPALTSPGFRLGAINASDLLRRAGIRVVRVP